MASTASRAREQSTTSRSQQARERSRQRSGGDTLLAEEVFTLFFDLFGHLRKHFADSATEVGLGPGQAKALRLLEAPMSMRAMAAALQCDASYITSLVDQLEGQGLAERLTDPRDRRVKLIHSTREGTRVRRRFEDLLFGGIPGAAGMGPDELLVLRDGLRTMLDGALQETARAD